MKDASLEELVLVLGGHVGSPFHTAAIGGPSCPVAGEVEADGLGNLVTMQSLPDDLLLDSQLCKEELVQVLPVTRSDELSN